MWKKYWKNSLGEIDCPGDSCKHKCTDKCPIWVRTQAAFFQQSGNYKLAVECYNKALKIEPDYRECWNNLGSLYGSIGEYRLAKESYLKAYALKPTKNNLYGLAIVCKDLGEFDESLRYIDLYEKNYSDNLLEDTKAYVNVLNKKSKESYKQLLMLIETAYDAGVLKSDKIQIIPSLDNKINSTVCEIIDYISNYNLKENKPIDYFTILLWCAYAGFGINIALLKDDNLDLSGSIIKYITDERGIFALDEYVANMVGIKTNPDHYTEEHLDFSKNFIIPYDKIQHECNFEDKKQLIMTAENVFIMGTNIALDYKY